jgi:hypothetical protein
MPRLFGLHQSGFKFEKMFLSSVFLQRYGSSARTILRGVMFIRFLVSGLGGEGFGFLRDGAFHPARRNFCFHTQRHCSNDCAI